MAEKRIEFEIDDNESDPDLVARAATKFLFEKAEKEAREFIEKDSEFSKLREAQKEFLIKLATNSIVDTTLEKFKDEISKKEQ